MTSTTTPHRADRRWTRVRRRAALAALLALGLAACGGDDDQASDSAAMDVAAADEPAAEERFAEDSAADAPADALVTTATGEAPATAAPIGVDFGRDLIIEAGIVIVTPDVRTAVDEIMQITRDNGGAIFNTDVVIEDPLEDGSVPGGGQITVRLPPAQLDLLIGDLRGVGTVRNQTQSVQDVTDRVTDLEVQIQQARISVERMEALLAEATDFDGLVAAERELVSRQTTYERLLAAQRNLGDRVALSTLLIQLQYAAPDSIDDPAVEQDRGIADAFSDGWGHFVGLLFGLAFVLAISAPFLAVGALIAGAGWLIARRLARRRDDDRNRHEPLDPPRPDTADADRIEQPVGPSTRD